MSVPEDNNEQIISVKETSLNQNKSNNNGSNTKSTIKQIFKKQRVNLHLLKEEILLNSSKADIESNLVTVKNPNSLYDYLFNIPNFKQYIKLYNFDSKAIIASFQFGKYVKLKKNFRLFNQGDKTDFFYLVIYGSVGLFVDIISLKSRQQIEVNSIKAGTYFGEWGLIFKINRTVSAYAKEDTLLLKFDKNCFEAFYQENIVKEENNSKKFVKNHIITMKKLGFSAFNQYYREIKKIYCSQGTQICCSGEEANCFYLIYYGFCFVKSGDNNLIIKDVGDFIGIESLFQDKYETNIYTHSEVCFLFKFMINTFPKFMLDNLRNEFFHYYQNQKRMFKLREENYEKYQNKYKIDFNNLIQNIKRNKIKNKKILSEMNLSELANNTSKYKAKNTRYSSPRKIKISFNSSNLSSNLDKIEPVRILTPKNNTRYKSSYNDIKNIFIVSKISKSLNHNVVNNLDKNKSTKSRNKKNFIKRFTKITSLNTKKRLKLKNTKNYSSFTEEMKEILPAYKKINMDNHFSSQNFKIRRKKINSALVKNKLKNNNIKNPKEIIYFDINNNYLYNEKVEKAFRMMSDSLLKTEKKVKLNNMNDFFENSKNSYKDNNNNIPLMIIRNYS